MVYIDNNSEIQDTVLPIFTSPWNNLSLAFSGHVAVPDLGTYAIATGVMLIVVLLVGIGGMHTSTYLMWTSEASADRISSRTLCMVQRTLLFYLRRQSLASTWYAIRAGFQARTFSRNLHAACRFDEGLSVTDRGHWFVWLNSAQSSVSERCETLSREWLADQLCHPQMEFREGQGLRATECRCAECPLPVLLIIFTKCHTKSWHPFLLASYPVLWNSIALVIPFPTALITSSASIASHWARRQTSRLPAPA